jgi:hypothetical protein
MKSLNMSLERAREWIFSTTNRESEFYPPKPRNNRESDTDKLIFARFCLLTHALMLVPHESIMKERGFAEYCVKRADLPIELGTVYLIYLRSMFTKGRGIKKLWMDRLFEHHTPIVKWEYMVARTGICVAHKIKNFHDDSLLGNYYLEFLNNRQEYRAYEDAQKKLLQAGKSVHILSSVEYFKKKGSYMKSESDGSEGGLSPERSKKRQAVEMDR